MYPSWLCTRILASVPYSSSLSLKSLTCVYLMFKVYLSEPQSSLGIFRNQVTDILAWTLQSFPTVLAMLPFYLSE